MTKYQFPGVALLLSAFLTISGCATPVTKGPSVNSSAIGIERQKQQQLVFDKYLANEARVQQVGYAIRRANLPICGEHISPAIGFQFIAENEIKDSDFKDIWIRDFGIDDQPTVIAVISGAPAANGGLLPRDKVISINGQAIVPGRRATKTILNILQKEAVADGSLTLGISRQGVESLITIQPEQSCDFGIAYVESPEINAWADGKSVYITRGILNLTNSNDELALVIGHELGHDAMHHVQKVQQNQMVAGLGGLFLDVLAAAGGVNTNGAFTDAAMDVAALSYSVDFEKEADYVGMYMISRAGFDTSQVANFWREMALEHPDSIIISRTHPTTPERFLAIEQTHAEISRKKATGQEIMPNLQD